MTSSLVEIIFKSFELLNLLDLLKCQFIPRHRELCSEFEPLRAIALNRPGDRLAALANLWVDLKLVCLELLLVLGVAHNVLQIFVQLCDDHIIENVRNLLGIMVHYQKLALRSLPAALEEYA